MNDKSDKFNFKMCDKLDHLCSFFFPHAALLSILLVKSLIIVCQMGFLHRVEEVNTSSFLFLNPQRLEC